MHWGVSHSIPSASHKLPTIATAGEMFSQTSYVNGLTNTKHTPSPPKIRPQGNSPYLIRLNLNTRRNFHHMDSQRHGLWLHWGLLCTSQPKVVAERSPTSSHMGVAQLDWLYPLEHSQWCGKPIFHSRCICLTQFDFQSDGIYCTPTNELSLNLTTVNFCF